MSPFLKSLATATVGAAAILAFFVGVVAPNVRAPVVGSPIHQETRQLVSPAAPAFHLVAEDGSVRVRTHRRDAIEVQAEVTVYSHRREVEAVMDRELDGLLALEEGEDRVVLVSEREPRPEGIDIFVDYTVFVPQGTDLDVVSANGNVWVARGSGNVSVRGRNTDIEILEPRGTVFARSTNGRIRVLDAQADTDLETVNGNVYAHMQGGALNANTINGAIVTRLFNADVSACDLVTQNGGITVVLETEFDAQIDARTARGSVRADAPFTPENGLAQRRQLRAGYGEGGTELSLETLNGNIRVVRSGRS